MLSEEVIDAMDRDATRLELRRSIAAVPLLAGHVHALVAEVRRLRALVPPTPKKIHWPTVPPTAEMVADASALNPDWGAKQLASEITLPPFTPASAVHDADGFVDPPAVSGEPDAAHVVTTEVG